MNQVLVALVGFMGAGKTTVGRAIAENLNVDFFDADEEIERISNRSIPELFATRGEQGFRALEADAVCDLLNRESAVVALGGGAIESPRVCEHLAKATVVFLDVSADEALRRIAGSTRPMLKERDPQALYSERRPRYERLADLTVSSDGTIEETVAAALENLPDEGEAGGAEPNGISESILVETPSASYQVYVGRGIATDLSRLVPVIGEADGTYVITQAGLTDVATRLGVSDARILLLDEGETAKSIDGVARVYETLAAHGAHRHDVVIALGGGVVTDVAGFVASTFNRGMPLVNVPTTLLGQVDAAIGGKNGVNLSRGKNLVGTIYQPSAVICDVNLLGTLPREEFTSGLAEVVKYGLIAEPSLLDTLLDHGAGLAEKTDLVADVVARSVAVKASIVSADERETGIRAHLNYGHTFAHAIEQSGGYGAIRHGEAVSLGMVAAAYLAAEMAMIGEPLVARHLDVLAALGLPVRSRLDLESLSEAWLRDKKYRGGVRFVLLEEKPDGTVSPRAGIEAPREAIATAIERLAE